MADLDISIGGESAVLERLTELETGVYGRTVAEGVLRPGEDQDAGLKRVANYLALVSATFTRPDDTTQYAAGDVVCDSTSAPTIMTFASAARYNNGGGRVLGVTVTQTSAQATKLDAELWLFDTTVAMDNDNAAFTPTDAEVATCIGVIDLGGAPFVGDATAGDGGNVIHQVTGLSLPFRTGAASQSIFGILVARNTYTPIAQEAFTVRLSIQQE